MSKYTGIAFDIYDRYVETPMGKDTLHYTVTIVYQEMEACFKILMSMLQARA